jgi:hypothetical protein
MFPENNFGLVSMYKKYLFIILLFIIIIMIWYHLPIKINETINICAIEGEKESIIFDIRWNRYLFKPTQMTGTIFYQGKEYRNITDASTSYKNGNYFEIFISNFKRKLQNEKIVPMFIISGGDQMDFVRNFIMPSVSDIRLNDFYLYIVKEKNEKTYYGPADTKEEAIQLMNGYIKGY